MGPEDLFMEAVRNRYNGGFNPMAAGVKRYGGTGRDAPNIGPTSGQEGYAERDRMAAARKRLILRRLQAQQRGNYMNPDVLRSM